MRVVHLDTGRVLRGGQRQVLLLHRELLDRGVDSAVVAPAGSPLAVTCRTTALPVVELPGRRPWRPGVLAAVRRAAKDAELLHAHDPHGALLAVLAARRDQRVVCHRRAGFPMRRGPVHRLKYRRVDRWIAVTDAIRDDLVAWGVPPERCRTVPSAVDLELVREQAASSDPVAVRRSLGLGAGARFVAAVGALDRQKGIGVAVRAAADLDDAVLVVVGDGPERRRLESVAGPGVRFAGVRDDVPAVLGAAAACVVPSLADEGSSAVLKEAMAVGCPVVASELPGLREVGGDAVRWIPPGDATALAAAVRTLLADRDVVAGLLRCGRERAAAFGVERMAAAVAGAYEDLLGERGR